MSAVDPLLDRAAIEDAFRRLGDRLARRGVVADLYVFGGAAMALAYDARRATRDIDAVFQPHGIVLEEAGAVAKDLGLPRWWLRAGQRLCRARWRCGSTPRVRPSRAESLGGVARAPARDEGSRRAEARQG